MRKLLFGLMLLGSLSSFAETITDDSCIVGRVLLGNYHDDTSKKNNKLTDDLESRLERNNFDINNIIDADILTEEETSYLNGKLYIRAQVAHNPYSDGGNFIGTFSGQVIVAKFKMNELGQLTKENIYSKYSRSFLTRLAAVHFVKNKIPTCLTE